MAKVVTMSEPIEHRVLRTEQGLRELVAALSQADQFAPASNVRQVCGELACRLGPEPEKLSACGKLTVHSEKIDLTERDRRTWNECVVAAQERLPEHTADLQTLWEPEA